VRIDVTGFAIFICAGKKQRSVALFAVGKRMAALQREAGFIMLKFDVQSQRRPPFGGVAITTGVFYFAMRVVLRGDLSESGNRSEHKKKSARKDAETQRTRRVFQRPGNKRPDLWKIFLCDFSASLRLCVKAFGSPAKG
jgi:hypothetical protein